nr:MAG TPA: type I neck protein [Caudoviricetes sp.]
MQAVLKARADTVKARCGDGYESYVAPTRAVAVVETSTPQAYDDNSAHNTLLKAASGTARRKK